MSIPVYRVCRSIHFRLDGKGAKLAGGRWNSPGTEVVYMSQSISLAVLENLVHLTRQDFPSGYVSIQANIPTTWKIEEASSFKLMYPHLESHQIGDLWLAAASSPAMRVPSAVVPLEWNYLLNPAHPDFPSLIIEPPQPFSFDPRLF
jgi:RES domain-containing protein